MFDGYLFIILLSLTIATVAGIIVQLLFSLLEVKKRRLQDRLGQGTSPADDESPYGDIRLEAPGDLTGLLGKSEAVQAFNTKLMRAYPGVVLQRFLFMIVAFAVSAAILAYIGTQSAVAAIFGGAVAGMLPFVIVSSRCAKRQKTIEDQLPEALDFLARVLRAGHGLATGLQMAADEIPQPLANEFRRCYDQHSLGTTLEQALKEMAERVGTPDFSFFVTAVLIQRTTGGDLAEVLTNIGNMVRARIRLQQHVKAVTAEGRLVAYVLLVLPVVFYVILYILNRPYARVLLDTQEGFLVLCVALLLQMTGLMWIKKIVSVKL